MVSKQAEKAHAALDSVEVTLDRIAALPLHELTLEERLTLWAQLKMLDLVLAKAAQEIRSAA